LRDDWAALLCNAGTIGMSAFGDRFIALVLALALSLGVLAVPMTGARAGPYEDALLAFTADSFGDTTEGINGVVASGNARAATIIGALQEGRLFFSAEGKRVFIQDKSDRLIDAATGEPVAGNAPATSRRCGSTTGCEGSSRPRSP